MAAPVYEAADDQGTGATGTDTVTVTKPTNLANGDVVVIIAAQTDGGTTATGPAGFTELSEFNSNANLCQVVYYKVITDAASEPADYTVTFSASGDTIAIIAARISGTDSTPVDVSGNATEDTAVIFHDVPQLTTTVDETLLLGAFAGRRVANFGWFQPTGYTEQREEFFDGGDACRLHVCTITQATAGATGAVTAESSSTVTSTLTHIAFQPPQAGGAASLLVGPDPVAGIIGR